MTSRSSRRLHRHRSIPWGLRIVRSHTCTRDAEHYSPFTLLGSPGSLFPCHTIASSAATNASPAAQRTYPLLDIPTTPGQNPSCAQTISLSPLSSLHMLILVPKTRVLCPSLASPVLLAILHPWLYPKHPVCMQEKCFKANIAGRGTQSYVYAPQAKGPIHRQRYETLRCLRPHRDLLDRGNAV